MGTPQSDPAVLERRAAQMSPLKADFIERFFLAITGIGSAVLIAASLYGIVLTS
jgi:hypothetical protein